MGRYATTSSISELVPNFLKGNTTTSDTAGTATFSRHIDRAEAVVDGYLAARYAVPFTTTAVPPLVKKWAEDIACFNALRATYAQDGQIRQEYVHAYEDSQKQLEAAAAGQLALLLSDGSFAPTRPSTRMLSTTLGYTPIFGRDDESAWKRDDDEVSDTEAGRG
jgi:phage gp36-like protein